jgi:hypothetical protein
MREGKPVQDIMQRLGLPAEDDTVMDPNQAAIALAMAMNQARMELTDREGVKSEARTYGAARLETLRKKLAPLYAAIPRDVEMFDLGLVAQDRPRLFVDIIAFIEMNRDQTAYRFLQETRAGRVTLAETGDDKVIIDHVTQYVARRLVERERALAAERHFGAPSPAEPTKEPVAAAVPEKLVPREMPRATSALPMTAAEAFRQWTRTAQDTAPAPLPTPQPLAHDTQAHAAPYVADAVSAASARGAREQAAQLSSETLPSLSATLQPAMTTVSAPFGQAQETVEAVAQAVAETAKPEAAAAPAPSLSKTALASAAVATAAAAGTTAMRTAPAATIRRSGSGWLIWPLLALLIGLGLGALALYLYAASLAR